MPKTRVIIINGVAESGKDTFVEYVSQYCQMDDSANVLNLSSVGPIKDMLMGFGWDGDKIFKVRDCISLIKDIWIRLIQIFIYVVEKRKLSNKIE